MKYFHLNYIVIYQHLYHFEMLIYHYSHKYFQNRIHNHYLILDGAL